MIFQEKNSFSSIRKKAGRPSWGLLCCWKTQKLSPTVSGSVPDLRMEPLVRVVCGGAGGWGLGAGGGSSSGPVSAVQVVTSCILRLDLNLHTYPLKWTLAVSQPGP